MFRQETNDTDLSQSAVVELGDKTLGLSFFAPVLGETKGVEKVEWNLVRDAVGFAELGECTWLSTTHVVGSVGLREVFQETNEKDDLPLSGIRESVPLLRRGHGLVDGTIVGSGPREVDSVGLNDVTNEGSHGNTSVLDLSLTQETDTGFLALTPDVDGGNFPWVVVLQKSNEATRLAIRTNSPSLISTHGSYI